MKFFLTVAVCILKFIYFFFKLLPTQNKILYLSRQSDTISVDFEMIYDKIKNDFPEIKQVVISRRMEKSFWGIFKNIWIFFPQMYHLATSKVCLSDGYSIPLSVLKHKKDLKVFQIWHSLIAVKKFGLAAQMSPRKKTVSSVLKMHNNYDFITCSAKAMIPAFSEAFGIPEEKFLEIGLPRIDSILKNAERYRKEFFQKYPLLKFKKILLYAPTFRDYNNYKINELISAKPDDAVLIVRLHPNTECSIEEREDVLLCKEFSTLKLLAVANTVITDYSGIIAEAAAIDTPVLIFAYDYEQYESTVGINIDLRAEFDSCVFDNAEELFASEAYKEYDMRIIRNFKEKYVAGYEGDCTEKLADAVLAQL